MGRILSNQLKSGGWEKDPEWYHPKYRTTVWQLILLSQTGIDSELEPVRRMCEYAFTFQSQSGAFVADRRSPEGTDWARDAGCLNGNVIAALCKLGCSRDGRMKKAVDHLLSIEEMDGGWGCRSVRSHSRAKHSCFMSAVCALDGLNEYRRVHHSEELDEAVERSAEFVLMHRLFRADHHGWKTIDNDWLLLRSPWMVGYDILRGLLAVKAAGFSDDKRASEAFSLLKTKMQPNGRWLREKRWPSNSYSSFGMIGTEDKWVTLNALRALDPSARQCSIKRIKSYVGIALQ